MKTTLGLFILILITLNLNMVFAQSTYRIPEFQNIQSSFAKVSFDFPMVYKQKDTLNVSFYIAEKDSIVFDMHYVNTASVSFSTNTSRIASSNDTLQKFVDFTMSTTNGTLVNQISVNTNNKPGYEAEVNYNDHDGNSIKAFYRYYWFNKRMYVFSISAKTNWVSTLLTYKSGYFSSINFF